MNENLASIQRIIDIQAIDNADSIETAKVLGWEIVVKKGEFKIGDLCTYIQIDTVVPEEEQFEFLRDRKFRVRSIKLRKQISQGLVIPLPKGNFNEGDDVTDLIGVKKYNKPVEIEEEIVIPKKHKKWWNRWFYQIIYSHFRRKTKKDFPSNLVSKTDEDRIQNKPNVLNKYKGVVFSVVEKLNGSSITIIRDKKWWWFYDRVCSRNNEILSKTNEFYKVYLDTNFKQYIDKLQEYFHTHRIIIQGEYIGKTQGNPYQLEKNEIRLFNIFVDGKKIEPTMLDMVCEIYNIPRCPKLDSIQLNHTMKELVQFAEGKSVLNKNTEREGLVLRDLDGKISFKVISNKYLLKNDE